MWRSGARTLALEVAFSAALVLVGELLFRLSDWDRLWAYVAALAVGWSVRVAVRHRQGRHPARAAEVVGRDGVTR